MRHLEALCDIKQILTDTGLCQCQIWILHCVPPPIPGSPHLLKELFWPLSCVEHTSYLCSYSRRVGACLPACLFALGRTSEVRTCNHGSQQGFITASAELPGSAVACVQRCLAEGEGLERRCQLAPGTRSQALAALAATSRLLFIEYLTVEKR